MGNESSSLVNLGDLTKPATILIEKISDAVGKIYEPHHIVNIAKAQATAKIIEAESNIEIAGLQKRALQRFIAEETRKQSNIELITIKALKGLNKNARPQDIEDDWIANFFNKCKLIADEEMQRLWAKILAGEANNPGAFSQRTVNYMSDIDKLDADLFTKLCSFCWHFYTDDTPEPQVLIYSHRENIYNEYGISFGKLMHLDEINLLTFQGFSEGFFDDNPGAITRSSYFGIVVNIDINSERNSNYNLKLGQVALSKVGRELSSICNSQPNSDFFDYVLRKWIDEGYIIYSDYPKYSG